MNKNANDRAEEKLTIEQTFARLDELLLTLEREDLPLEDSFELYAKGLSLIKECRDSIDEVEKKVRLIEEGGEIREF